MNNSIEKSSLHFLVPVDESTLLAGLLIFILLLIVDLLSKYVLMLLISLHAAAWRFFHLNFSFLYLTKHDKIFTSNSSFRFCNFEIYAESKELYKYRKKKNEEKAYLLSEIVKFLVEFPVSLGLLLLVPQLLLLLVFFPATEYRLHSFDHLKIYVRS